MSRKKEQKNPVADALTSGIKDEVDKETVLLMFTLIPEDPDAALLIRHCISWSATYDHIVDGDKWDAQQVHDMVSILLSELPTNRFYSNNLHTYLPIIMNAIHSWRYAETHPEYRIKVSDGLSELGCAMLYCVGGSARLNEHGDKWRDQVRKLMKSSDKGD